jgi:mRNA interferase MazF
MSPVRRGDVVALRPTRDATGHEQRGARYGVVVQSDGANWLATLLIAPTSTSAQPAVFRPQVTVRGRDTWVLVDQLTAFDRTRVGRSAGRLSGPDLRELDDSLKLVLGLV